MDTQSVFYSGAGGGEGFGAKLNLKLLKYAPYSNEWILDEKGIGTGFPVDRSNQIQVQRISNVDHFLHLTI